MLGARVYKWAAASILREHAENARVLLESSYSGQSIPVQRCIWLLRPCFRPLRSYFSYRQFLVAYLVNSSGDRLRILLANLGYRDSACLHRVLNDRGIEIFELIEVRPLEIVQMEN